MDSLWRDFINCPSVDKYLRYKDALNQAQNDGMQNKQEVRKNGF